jgi:hypothetical protein
LVIPVFSFSLIDLEDDDKIITAVSVASIAGDDMDDDFFFFFFLKSVLVVRPESRRALLLLAAAEAAFSSAVMDRFRLLDLLLVDVEATAVLVTLDDFSVLLAEVTAVVPADESPFRF